MVVSAPARLTVASPGETMQGFHNQPEAPMTIEIRYCTE